METVEGSDGNVLTSKNLWSRLESNGTMIISMMIGFIQCTISLPFLL